MVERRLKDAFQTRSQALNQDALRSTLQASLVVRMVACGDRAEAVRQLASYQLYWTSDLRTAIRRAFQKRRAIGRFAVATLYFVDLADLVSYLLRGDRRPPALQRL